MSAAIIDYRIPADDLFQTMRVLKKGVTVPYHKKLDMVFTFAESMLKIEFGEAMAKLPVAGEGTGKVLLNRKQRKIVTNQAENVRSSLVRFVLQTDSLGFINDTLLGFMVLLSPWSTPFPVLLNGYSFLEILDLPQKYSKQEIIAAGYWPVLVDAWEEKYRKMKDVVTFLKASRHLRDPLYESILFDGELSLLQKFD